MSPRAIRWIARIWTIPIVGLFLVIVVGEGGFDPRDLTLTESIEMALFLGIFCGMVIAWRREGIGGVVSLGCLVGFYAVNRISSGRFPSGWFFPLMAVPSLLFLLGWFRDRRPIGPV